MKQFDDQQHYLILSARTLDLKLILPGRVRLRGSSGVANDVADQTLTEDVWNRPEYVCLQKSGPRTLSTKAQN